jgi:hypothetical protein
MQRFARTGELGGFLRACEETMMSALTFLTDFLFFLRAAQGHQRTRFRWFGVEASASRATSKLSGGAGM